MAARLDGAAIEAVIFDWGGTLSTFATSLSIEEPWEPAAAALAPFAALPEAEIAARLAAAEAAFWERTATDQRSARWPASSPPPPPGSARTRRPRRSPPPPAPTSAPHIEHDAEAVAVLEALRAAGVRTAMLSNTHWPRAFHERFLVRDGLAPLLGERVYTCELERMKPHPDAFAAALGAAGVADPARALFVGDRPRDDIHGAQRAGLRTALRVNPLVPAWEVTPDAEIERLSALLALLGLAA